MSVLLASLALALLAEPPPAELPAYDEAPIVGPDGKPVPLRRPVDGGVVLGFGAVAGVAGVGMLIGSVLAAEHVGSDEESQSVWQLQTTPHVSDRSLAIGLGVSGGVLLAGVAMLATGMVRRRTYLRTDLGQTAPATGRALQASGLVLIVLGAATTAVGVFTETQRCEFDVFEECEPPIRSGALLGVGVGSIAAGISLLVVGGDRERKWKNWARERAVRPGIGFSREAVRLGLSGRF